jgi:outer membrane protein OmpA-like peptidoglycan-associated protein
MRIFIIILWLFLGVIYWWLWDRGVDNCCEENSTKTEAAVVNKEPDKIKTIVKSLPLAFNWNGEKTVLGDGFKAYKDSILSTIKDDRIFEITGFYSKGEKNPSDYENLGIARANEIRKLFPEITDEKLRLFGKLVDEKNIDNSKPFVSAAFKSAINGVSVKEVDDKAMIYFPFNSTDKLDNSKIESYLNDVAERVLKSGEKVYLTGHTDNVGSDESNVTLGKRRANIMKNYLLSKGVSSNQLIVSSEGENSPIATNDNSQGRAKNRRVELIIK